MTRVLVGNGNDMFRLLKTCGVVGLVMASSMAFGEALPFQCGRLDNHYGPFDYRTDKSKLPVVEHRHFTPQIETLQSGMSGTIAADLDYTLRAFPNHHRALLAMVRLGERDRTASPRGARYTVDCYLRRGEVFRADDGVVKMLRGIFMMKQGDNKGAIEKLQEARTLNPNDANLNYNLGLAFFRLNRFDEALEQAHLAYGAGFSLPGLKSMLQKAGKWRDAPVSSEVQSPSETPAD